MQFQIRTRDSDVAEELKKTAPPGVSIGIQYLMTRSATDPGWVIVTFQFIRDKAVDIDIGLFAAWIYDKTKKDKTCRIRNRGKEVIKTQAGIRRGIQEHLEIGKND